MRLERWEITVLKWCLIWASFQAISDLLNDTQLLSSIKGVGAPLILGSTAVGFSRWYEKRPDALSYVLLGTALTSWVNLYLYPDVFQQGNPWKWGGGEVVMLIGLIAVSFWFRPPRLVIFVLIIVFSLMCLLNNSRSMAMFPLLGYSLYSLAYRGRWNSLWNYLGSGTPIFKIMIPLAFAIFFANYAAYSVFSSGMVDGLLPAEAGAKFREQATSSAGLLLAGRSESLISTRAFFAAPFFGHGSWAQDKDGYVQEYLRLRYEYGAADELEQSDLTLIPVHSYLFGALVWAGVMGGISWLMLANGLLKRYLMNVANLPLYFHVGTVTFLWNLFFSPFGADARWQTGLFFAALYMWSYRRVVAK